MKKIAFTVILLCTAASGMLAAPKDSKKAQSRPPSALDKYIEQASQPEPTTGPMVPSGSLWTPAAWFSDLAADQRSRRVDDIVTIAVQESASAVSTGAVKTSRQSSTQNSITALAGLTKTTGPWANLANLGGQTSLNGQGTTSRTTTLTTTVSARVTHVLRNGNLVVEGGVIRPIDLDTTNTVPSSRLAQMEIQVNGKGVVEDSVHRPNILYRLLLGILPF